MEPRSAVIDDTDKLLERLAAGDRRAMARVTRLIAARLRRLGAYDMREEWEDLSQDVIWALVRAVRDGRAPQSDGASAYVGAVVYNHFVSRLRSRQAHPDRRAVSYVDDGPPAESAARYEPASQDERLAARLALASLPEEWQTLLVARHVEEQKIDVLVRSGDRSRASVNRDLKRAREAFRAALLGEDGHGRAAATAPTDEPLAGKRMQTRGKER